MASSPEPRAVQIAAHLCRVYGTLALRRAMRRLDRAESTGNIARADLYCAVCTIIGDRDAVFSRLRGGAIMLARHVEAAVG